VKMTTIMETRTIMATKHYMNDEGSKESSSPIVVDVPDEKTESRVGT
jgi:hypothetical protein